MVAAFLSCTFERDAAESLVTSGDEETDTGIDVERRDLAAQRKEALFWRQVVDDAACWTMKNDGEVVVTARTVGLILRERVVRGAAGGARRLFDAIAREPDFDRFLVCAGAITGHDVPADARLGGACAWLSLNLTSTGTEE